MHAYPSIKGHAYRLVTVHAVLSLIIPSLVAVKIRAGDLRGAKPLGFTRSLGLPMHGKASHLVRIYSGQPTKIAWVQILKQDVHLYCLVSIT